MMMTMMKAFTTCLFSFTLIYRLICMCYLRSLYLILLPSNECEINLFYEFSNNYICIIPAVPFSVTFPK
jgi:hypothetical protein